MTQCFFDGGSIATTKGVAPIASQKNCRFEVVKMSVERDAAVRPSHVALARTFATVHANDGMGVPSKVTTSVEERQQIAVWLAAHM